MRASLLLSFVLAATLGASPVQSATALQGGAADPRIKTVDYHADQVVRIVGVLRAATQIRFGLDETILHVAIGDTSGWEVAPETSILFAKPTMLAAPTNLIVTTRTAAGQSRHYTFELATRRGATRRDSPNTYFVVQFRYPAEERAAVAAALDAEAQALEARILQLRLDRGVLQGPRNLAYELQGAAAIAPSEVSDNGRFTVLRFPGAQPIPAIYAVSPDGRESLVPFDVRGEFLVVHQTAAQLRLRRGRAVVCVFNLSFQPAGVTTGTATSAPDVDRTLKAGARP